MVLNFTILREKKLHLKIIDVYLTRIHKKMNTFDNKRILFQ